MSKSKSVCLRFPTSEFRVLPIPTGDSTKRAKIATCFVRVNELPAELGNWMEVNPRIPRFNKNEQLQGKVAIAMVRTLQEEPEKFALKNQGIYLLVKEVKFDKQEGGHGFVEVTLDSLEYHGLVNGGHTFRAIRQVAEERDAEEPEHRPDWEAYVRLHIMEGIEEDLITDIAEGLNRSMQVDDPSLENLRGNFAQIKEHLEGKPGSEQIAYRQGDPGNIDILHVLTIIGMLDLSRFPDRKSHPNSLFGHPKAVLEHFIKDKETAQPVFNRILPKLHEILVLTDTIQQDGVQKLGRLKISSSKKENRVRSPRHKGRPAYFANGTIDGSFPLGWLYPMVAAFRANISVNDWEAGKLEWLMDPKELLKEVVGEMAEIVKQEHDDNKGKPAEVGRKEAAYRACYSVVTMELAKRGLLSK